MNNPLIPTTVLLGAAVLAMPLAAQTTTAQATSSSHAAAAHSSSTATHEVPCARPAPHMPANVPALPATAPCPKALYTLRTTPSTHMVYASPLLSDEVRDALGSGPMTFSLDYVDSVVGTGAKVEAGKYVSVKYTGYLSLPDAQPDTPEGKKDGTVFDSTEQHPGKEAFPFQYGNHGVIEGWDTGFEGMRVGGKRRIFIPWELAYGERGRGPIPPKADLIFDVEVVSQSTTPPAPPARPLPPGMGHPGTPPAGASHPTTITPQPPQTTAPGSTAAPQTGNSTTPQPNKPQ
jgi:peptidylprolyl isomerase